MNEDSHPNVPAGDAPTTTKPSNLWIVIDEDEAWLFDNEHKAWNWADDYLAHPDATADDVYVVPLTGDYRKKCTSTDPNDHQGDTCPIHEGEDE